MSAIIRNIVSSAFLALLSMGALAQNLATGEGLSWSVEMIGQGTSGDYMPFWSHVNKNGVLPMDSGGIMSGTVRYSRGMSKGWRFSAGGGLAGYFASKTPDHGVESCRNGYGMEWKGMVRELYGTVGWRNLNLDLGVKERPVDFGGLSLSGGDISWSGNSRSVPGYLVHTDWMAVPKTRGVLSVRGDFGDFMMLDKRYVRHALLHTSAAYLRLAPCGKFSFIAGLEVWSQWAGTSPAYGKLPHSFKDYLRVLTGASGGEDASVSDQINVLGNSLGRELIRLDWKDEEWSVTFQHDIPFEDRSGMRFQNFPDGLNTVAFSFRDKDKWVSDIVLEYAFTKWQSGTRHDRPATDKELEKNPDKPTIIIGGCDNYFNNGEYRSGWTYHGRTVGLPLFIPMPENADGLVLGVCNNRIEAWHLGLSGKVARKAPYKLLLTYTKNFGAYSQRLAIFNDTPRQVSGALEVSLPRRIFRGTTGVTFGLYADKGSLYQDNLGLSLRLNWGWN